MNDEEPVIKKRKPKKVIIEITDGHKHPPDTMNGCEYVSVSFMASLYGGTGPNYSEEDIISSVEHYKKWIIREGDIPIVVDKRTNKPEQQYKPDNLNFWINEVRA